METLEEEKDSYKGTRDWFSCFAKAKMRAIAYEYLGNLFGIWCCLLRLVGL